MQHHGHYYLLLGAVGEAKHQKSAAHMVCGVGLGAYGLHSRESAMVVLNLPNILLGIDYQLLAIAAGDAVGTIESVDISLVIACYKIVVIHLGCTNGKFVGVLRLRIAARRYGKHHHSNANIYYIYNVSHTFMNNNYINNKRAWHSCHTLLNIFAFYF